MVCRPYICLSSEATTQELCGVEPRCVAGIAWTQGQSGLAWGLIVQAETSWENRRTAMPSCKASWLIRCHYSCLAEATTPAHQHSNCAAMCQDSTGKHQKSKNDWIESQPLHRQLLSQPVGREDDSFSSHTLPHSVLTGPVVLCACFLWLRDCPDPAIRTCSACTGLIEDGEQHSRNCSWVLETILVKSLHSSQHCKWLEYKQLWRQWMVKNHAEKKCLYSSTFPSTCTSDPKPVCYYRSEEIFGVERKQRIF